jgi:hypothetical protein
MNAKYFMIQAEREKWEKEKEMMRKYNKIDGEVVKLNVGGKVHIHTEKSVL